MRVRACLAMGLIVLPLAAGCGGGDTPQASGSSGAATPAAAGDDEAVIEDLVVRWGHADTADEICDLIGEGFKTAFNAVEDCPAALTQAIETGRMKPESEDLTVEDVKISGTRAAATVEGSGRTSYVLLVKNLDEWRIDGQTDTVEHAPAAYKDVLPDA